MLGDVTRASAARKVHPLNEIAGGGVHLAVDIPLNIIVNIINPPGLRYFHESRE